MALEQCRECGGQVSAEVETCPHCGIRSPTARSNRGVRAIWISLAAVFVFGMVWLIFPGTINTDNSTTSASSPPRSSSTAALQSSAQSISGVLDVRICRDALTPSQTAWDQDPKYSEYVAEARRRGYTVATCRQKLAAASASTPPPSTPILRDNVDASTGGMKLNSGMKLKRLWTYTWNRWEQCDRQKYRYPLCAAQYFQCDYTSKTCEQGFRFTGESLFVLLAEDRKTPIDHLFCSEYGCLSFDSGKVQADPRLQADPNTLTMSEDLPVDCVSYSRSADYCDGWISQHLPPVPPLRSTFIWRLQRLGP
jgi:hypothetical protein